MLSRSAEAVPQTMLSRLSLVPQTMLPQSLVLQSVPHTMLSPSASLASPQTTLSCHAGAFGLITPPPIRWLPQLILWLQGLAVGYFLPAVAVAKNFARSTAPLVLRKPAPSVSVL